MFSGFYLVNPCHQQGPLYMKDTHQQQRQKLVQGALAMMADTPQEAGLYEQQLLEQYVQGILSIDQVVQLVEQQHKVLNS
jgi:hypothetical protein